MFGVFGGVWGVSGRLGVFGGAWGCLGVLGCLGVRVLGGAWGCECLGVLGSVWGGWVPFGGVSGSTKAKFLLLSRATCRASRVPTSMSHLDMFGLKAASLASLASLSCSGLSAVSHHYKP